jgi:two-component system sensor histidine kinase DegS
MNIMAKLRSLELDKLSRSPHFWTAVAITAAIAVLYYKWAEWFPWYWRFFIFEFANDIIGLLFFVPFLYAAIVFWWRGALIIWLLSAVTLLPFVVHYSVNIEDFIRNVIFSLLPLSVAALVALEIEWRSTQRKVMVEREKERQLYMAEVLKAQEDERHRIALELHDNTTQELLVIANRVQALMSNAECGITAEARRHAEWIRDAILQISKNIRNMSLDMRPSLLDDVGLVSALRWSISRLNQDSGIKTKVVLQGMERKLSPEVEVQIFRIIQESLSNIRRHSNATEVLVTLSFTPHSFEITVQDNGKGFAFRKTIEELTPKGKLGLIGMQQRAELVGGVCAIQSQPGKGTLVSVRIEN